MIPGYYDESSLLATMAQNVGSMRNQGIEVTISSTNIQKKDFLWTTSLNFGHNSNKVTELTGDDDKIISGAMIHQVGKPYYSYYMYEYAGVTLRQVWRAITSMMELRMLARPLLM